MDSDQHEPSAAERTALHGPPIPPPAGDPGPAAMPAAEQVPDPEPAEPGPCKECAGRGDTMLAIIALGVAAVIAIMAVDLLTGGQLSGLVFGGQADGSE